MTPRPTFPGLQREELRRREHGHRAAGKVSFVVGNDPVGVASMSGDSLQGILQIDEAEGEGLADRVPCWTVQGNGKRKVERRERKQETNRCSWIKNWLLPCWAVKQIR